MPESLTNFVETTQPTLLASDPEWRTEGPLWHAQGYLTFVDLGKSQLLRWSPGGKVTTVRAGTGEGNGCTFDRSGNLLMCEGADHRRISRMFSSGVVATASAGYQGKRLNKPNDVVCRSDGSIYFTDPELRVPKDQRELGFSGVFRISPDGATHLGTDECEYPNGLAFSPDEKVLYVAISRLDERCIQEEERKQVCAHRKIRAFDVARNGTLSNNRVLVDLSSAEPGVPDGMKVDSKGRIFSTGSGGIQIISSQGERLATIRVPEVPRNLAFGGADFKTLFITAGKSLYSIKVKEPGIAPY
ncbi:MAG: SMP-30/gluconolactonase/LRE family protein [SAR202 cluster bacterium]|nr:SMP-30/gluconolactonase/LRE family protein [SAR202 cluster bacterium]